MSTLEGIVGIIAGFILRLLWDRWIEWLVSMQIERRMNDRKEQP